MEWEREVCQRFPFANHSFYSDLTQARWRNLVFVECLMVGFCFFGGWCYSERWGWDLITLAQFQESEMSPGLFQDFIGWAHKTLRLFPLVVEHSVVVMTAGFQSRRSQSETYGQPIFGSRFIKLVFRIRGGHTILRLSWGLRHWRPEFNYSVDRMLIICFSILKLWTLCGKLMKG